MKTIINPRNGVLAVIIVAAGVWRLLVSAGHTPLSNFTPVGAMALFGGCYFRDKWKAYLVPILTLWLSDLFLSFFVYYHELRWFYEGFLWTYGSFALMVVMGMFIKKINIKSVAIAGVSAAVAHWVITDFGVWIGEQLYPKTMEGLIICFTVAIPYLKNMLISNLIFSAVMFGVFELAQRKFPVLSLQKAN